MMRAEASVITLEVLEARRTLACLQYYTVIDLVPVTLEERLMRPNARYRDRVGIAADEVTLASHALGEFRQFDTGLESEQGWIPIAKEGFTTVAKEIKGAGRFVQGREFSARYLPEQRFDFHRMLYALRLHNGGSVFSPFGRAFAKSVAERKIDLCQTIAVTAADIVRIPGQGPLKQQLLAKVA